MTEVVWSLAPKQDGLPGGSPPWRRRPPRVRLLPGRASPRCSRYRRPRGGVYVLTLGAEMRSNSGRPADSGSTTRGGRRGGRRPRRPGGPRRGQRSRSSRTGRRSACAVLRCSRSWPVGAAPAGAQGRPSPTAAASGPRIWWSGSPGAGIAGAGVVFDFDGRYASVMTASTSSAPGPVSRGLRVEFRVWPGQAVPMEPESIWRGLSSTSPPSRWTCRSWGSRRRRSRRPCRSTCWVPRSLCTTATGSSPSVTRSTTSG